MSPQQINRAFVQTKLVKQFCAPVRARSLVDLALRRVLHGRGCKLKLADQLRLPSKVGAAVSFKMRKY